MHLVDTCGWIEWITDSPLAEDYAAFLNAEADTLLVPTLVQLELYKWLCREKDLPTALAAAATQSARIVPLDTSLALLAANFSREFKLATADAIIYATARSHGARLITSDAHFSGLPEVYFLKKAG